MILLDKQTWQTCLEVIYNITIPSNLEFMFLWKVIQERRKERKAGIVKKKKDLLDLLMDMYDEETDSKMDDEELRSQVLGTFKVNHS